MVPAARPTYDRSRYDHPVATDPTDAAHTGACPDAPPQARSAPPRPAPRTDRAHARRLRTGRPRRRPRRGRSRRLRRVRPAGRARDRRDHERRAAVHRGHRRARPRGLAATRRGALPVLRSLRRLPAPAHRLPRATAPQARHRHPAARAHRPLQRRGRSGPRAADARYAGALGLPQPHAIHRASRRRGRLHAARDAPLPAHRRVPDRQRCGERGTDGRAGFNHADAPVGHPHRLADRRDDDPAAAALASHATRPATAERPALLPRDAARADLPHLGCGLLPGQQPAGRAAPRTGGRARPGRLATGRRRRLRRRRHDRGAARPAGRHGRDHRGVGGRGQRRRREPRRVQERPTRGREGRGCPARPRALAGCRRDRPAAGGHRRRGRAGDHRFGGAGGVVYVSCDPGTLARDLRRFEDGGFTVGEVQPFDMFPHTQHIECITTLDRERPARA